MFKLDLPSRAIGNDARLAEHAAIEGRLTRRFTSYAYDQGALEGFAIPSLGEEQQRLEERIARVEAQVVPTGTIAFFDLHACPVGWVHADDVKGRYVVGVLEDGVIDAKIGSQLNDSENRPTGEHTHTQAGLTIVDGSHGWPGAQMGNDGWRLSNPGTTASGGVSGGASGGTNAPYIQLLACRKTGIKASTYLLSPNSTTAQR